MISQELLERVVADVRRHVRRSKGHEEGPWVNPLAPADCVAAFSMARLLTGRGLFDHCIAVAPEGHVYGYFFERLGVPVLSVHVGKKSFHNRQIEAFGSFPLGKNRASRRL
jgi:hypothetical protein